MRDSKGSQINHSTAGAYSNRNGQTNNFRGRGSGYSSNRGNMGNNAGGNFNRNFSGSQMSGMAGGFQPSMGGFQGNQMGGPYGGYNRGGMMGGMRGGAGNMRGGRVGMGNGMMMGIPMGGMPMGAMGGAMAGMAAPMGMGQMGGGMPGMMTLNSHVLTSGTRRRSVHSATPLPPRFPSPSGLSTKLIGPMRQTSHENRYHTQPELQAKAYHQPTGAGFQGLQPHFNPAFFQPNQPVGGDWQNPHGAKRPRPE
jgi:hypothetical protein